MKEAQGEIKDNLRKINKLNINSLSNSPLCYPLFLKRSGIREKLIKERIFVATYWPEVLKRVSGTSNESELVNFCLPLPCDQRYGIFEMNRIVNFILNII